MNRRTLFTALMGFIVSLSAPRKPKPRLVCYRYYHPPVRRVFRIVDRAEIRRRDAEQRKEDCQFFRVINAERPFPAETTINPIVRIPA